MFCTPALCSGEHEQPLFLSTACTDGELMDGVVGETLIGESCNAMTGEAFKLATVVMVMSVSSA